jgi:cysteinyl-tRNA synthetase
MATVGCLPPTHQPRATGHVAGMVAMIGELIAGGHAYAAEGHVLFAVDSFTGYGALSGRSVDDMIAGARVEVAPYKKNPMDFVLWKPSAPDQPGWDSPWGRGRPGWHIECSAMARSLLGPDFDIHAGGSDLLFPHHENEIAQSLCADPGHGFARYWVHNGMVQVEGKKMSKSLGNFFTVQDKLAEGVPGEVMRLALLMTRYADELDWTEARVEEAHRALVRWGRAASAAPGPVPEAVVAALADDLNTPGVIAQLHRLAGEGDAAGLAAAMDLLNLRAPRAAGGAEAGPRIDALLSARAQARAAKDFARADAIRKGLDAAGVVVMDRPGAATEWELGAAFDAGKLAAIEP